MGRTQQAGFTLAELMATAAIAGIAISLSVGGFSHTASEERRAAATNQLVGTLHVARSAAMMRNQSVTICPSTDQQSCTQSNWEQGWIVFVDAAQTHQPGPDGLLLAEPPLAAQLTLDSLEFDAYLSYRPNGQVMVDSTTENVGQFHLCDGPNAEPARTILINATGKPRLGDQQVNADSFVCES
jgi:type IV fimbrial biogenesis protein FimT